MLKYEEAQKAKTEYECRMVMMTDKTKPKGPQKGEDLFNPSIFVVNALPQAPREGKPNRPRHRKKPKRKEKKTQPQVDPEIYVIKTTILNWALNWSN